MLTVNIIHNNSPSSHANVGIYSGTSKMEYYFICKNQKTIFSEIMGSHEMINPFVDHLVSLFSDNTPVITANNNLFTLKTTHSIQFFKS